jgi:hypothetical protein
MKYELKRIDLWSVAKLSFLLGCAFGFFTSIMIWMFSGLFSQFASMSGNTVDMDAMESIGLIGIIMGAGMWGVMMMIGNVILASFYNLFASLVGGLELSLEVEPLVASHQQPVPATYKTPEPPVAPTYQTPSPAPSQIPPATTAPNPTTPGPQQNSGPVPPAPDTPRS